MHISFAMHCTRYSVITSRPANRGKLGTWGGIVIVLIVLTSKTKCGNTRLRKLRRRHIRSAFFLDALRSCLLEAQVFVFGMRTLPE